MSYTYDHKTIVLICSYVPLAILIHSLFSSNIDLTDVLKCLECNYVCYPKDAIISSLFSTRLYAGEDVFSAFDITPFSLLPITLRSSRPDFCHFSSELLLTLKWSTASSIVHSKYLPVLVS